MVDKQQYIKAVDELTQPTSTELEAHLGIASSTIRSHLREIGEIAHERGQGYYLVPDVDADTEDTDTDESDTDSVDTSDSPNYYQEEIPQGVIDELQGNGLTYADIESLFDIGPDEARNLLEELEQRGYAVDFNLLKGDTRLWYIEDRREKQYALGNGDGTYNFGLISDTHLGSSEEHLNELEDFYDRLVDRDIHHVFHAGDISDGWKVYKHHHQQLKDAAVGWERLKEYVVDNYPQRDSITTHFITGNHDYKLWKRSGMYFGEQIDNRRDDLNWLAPIEATINFHPEVDLELIHPSGGTPYTLGYRAQTLYRERDPENRPSIGAIGHLHGRMQANAEGVEAFYTGAWQGPTPYVKRKGLPTNVGGWIVDLEIENGGIRKLGADWIKYPVRGTSDSIDTTELTQL